MAAVASMCSLVRAFAGALSDADHRVAVAQRWTELLGTCVDRVMRHRDEHGGERFLDVSYDALVADPIAAVRGIYGWLGADLAPETEARMRAYLAANPQGAHGSHAYDADDLRLDAGAVAERFAAYAEAFGLRG
jgi:hypothetical protein